MRVFLTLTVIVIAPLFLTACGDEWEMVRTTSVFPYGNARTAGSGVMYVRKSLAPLKDLKIVNIKRDYSPKVAEDLRIMFDKDQRK